MWQIRPLKGKAQRAFERLTMGKQEAVFEALEAIERAPYYDPDRPKAIRHMKGKEKGQDWDCCREFRALPQAMRIVYRVHASEREVEIKYIGPHP